MLLSGMAARPAFQLRFFVWRLKIVHRTRAMPASTSQRRTKPKVRRNSDVILLIHFAMADSAQLAKENKLAEFVDNEFEEIGGKIF